MAKILLVEDNESIRRAMTLLLQRRGHTIVTAEDGEQAVEMAGSERPNLILMDLNLPILDGWQATRQIKRNPELRHIPIVALTAGGMAQDREFALNAGCDEFASKLLEINKLAELILRVLEAARCDTKGTLRVH